MQKAKFSIELAQAFFSSTDDFPVDLDDAWGWLGYAEKRNALRKLAGNFKEGTDYTFARSGEQGVPLTFSDFQAANPDKYMLTVDCFKRLAMLAETDQGDQVRTYFIQCETTAKLLAAEVPTLKAELERLKALVAKSSKDKSFSGAAAYRPDPADFARGCRVENDATWRTRGTYDPEGARKLMRELDLTVDLYVQHYRSQLQIEMSSDAAAQPTAEPPHDSNALRRIRTIANGAPVFCIPPLAEIDKITALPATPITGGCLRYSTFQSTQIYAAACKALKAAQYPNAFDSKTLIDAVFCKEVIAWADAQHHRLALSLTRAIKDAGYNKRTGIRYSHADSLDFGRKHAVVWSLTLGSEVN